MEPQRMHSVQSFDRTISINATVSKVCHALTNSELMKQWMAEEGLEIETDWKIGSAIIIKGNKHWVYFENKGVILQFEPERIFHYSHLSSLSKLPDLQENYTVIEFRLNELENETALTITLRNFPTESIYKHLAFYWSVTIKY
jgi:uncharacterized protein YndB with AHSA1/START domain